MDYNHLIFKGFSSELEKLGFFEGLGEGIGNIAQSAWGGLKQFGSSMINDTGAASHIKDSLANPSAASGLAAGTKMVGSTASSPMPLISPALYSMLYGGTMLSKPGGSRLAGAGRGALGGLLTGGLTHGLNLLASGASILNPMASVPILGLSALMGGVAGLSRANKQHNELQMAKMRAAIPQKRGFLGF